MMDVALPSSLEDLADQNKVERGSPHVDAANISKILDVNHDDTIQNTCGEKAQHCL